MKRKAHFTKHDRYRYNHARLTKEASKLEPEVRTLIYDRYAHNQSWQSIADSHNMGIGEAMRALREAVEMLCRYIDTREGRGIRPNPTTGKIKLMEKLK